MKKKAAQFVLLLLVVTMLFATSTPFSYATEDTMYYLGEVVNTGKDTGYSESHTIEKDDPHFGWKLGRFCVSDFTRVVNESTDSPVFLKNVGDTVTLWFNLDQDIDNLNGNKMLSIFNDENGYDTYFGIGKTGFGRGTLIIRHTDYQNNKSDPVIYTNYLEANASTGANVQVDLFEEGDYEVALNYEIRKANLDIFGWDTLPSFFNYRIYFKFSVRNGNCMVYPFDVVTGNELNNTALTENGFYLDLAKSRYLDTDVKREILNEGADGLVEDTRFNRPAHDGEQYTDDGIYTITVSNRYTGQQTVKKIYVGTNKVLKAHVVTGLPISEITYQLSNGATVAPDGTLIPPEPTQPTAEPTIPPTQPENNQADTNHPIVVWPYVLIGLLVCAIGSATVFILKRKTANNDFHDGGSEQ